MDIMEILSPSRATGRLIDPNVEMVRQSVEYYQKVPNETRAEIVVFSGTEQPRGYSQEDKSQLLRLIGIAAETDPATC